MGDTAFLQMVCELDGRILTAIVRTQKFDTCRLRRTGIKTFDVLLILDETCKSLRLEAHHVDCRPMRIIIQEFYEVVRAPQRGNVERTHHVGMNQFEEGGGGSTTGWERLRMDLTDDTPCEVRRRRGRQGYTGSNFSGDHVAYRIEVDM